MTKEASLILDIENGGKPEQCLMWLVWDDCGHVEKFTCNSSQFKINHDFSTKREAANLNECMRIILVSNKLKKVGIRVTLPGVDTVGTMDSYMLKVIWELDRTSDEGVSVRYVLSNESVSWETNGDPHLDSAIVTLSKKSAVRLKCCSNCSNADSPYDLEDNFWTGIFCMRDSDNGMQGKLETQEILKRATMSGVWGFHCCPQFRNW